MNWIIKTVLFVSLFISYPAKINAQEEKKEKDKKNSPASERVKRKKAKAKWKEERENKLLNEKAIRQHHKRLQTKKTLKEMRKLRKKSKRHNATKRR